MNSYMNWECQEILLKTSIIYIILYNNSKISLFLCVFMVNDMNYRFNAMTLAELLSMPGMVRPIGAPI